VAGSQALAGIRQLFSLSEFEEVLRLQQAIWGFADIELLPLRFLVVVSNVGGHVFGAFDGDMMVGFCFDIPGIKPGGRPYLHSHMLGVLPAYRNAGIGRRLKLRQRAEALAEGIELIEWTFDPLELKNAFLNIERLGTVVRRYHENQYGVTASPLHGGLPTDRCYAEWWIDSPRVRGILAEDQPAAAPPTGRPADTDEALAGGPVWDQRTAPRTPIPAAAHAGPADPPQCRIAYPADIARLRSGNPRRAREIQKHNGERFQHAFQQGLAVTGFERGDTEGAYLLEPWP
jgi:predicted GNAT superfamily acetyltransferase